MPLSRRKPKGNWHAEYVDCHGKRIRKSTGTPNKMAAQEILDHWKLEATKQRHGTAQLNTSLDELIKEYIAYIGNSGDKHRDHTEVRIRRVVDTCGWTKPEQIARFQVETAVSQLKKTDSVEPLSLRTKSHYLAACKMFTRWLTDIRLVLPRDPLAAVKKPRWESDRILTRRFLHPEEWQWLALTPNALLYETAIQTGFRSAELLKLDPSSLRDDHLYLPARFTKNKQDATQYITADLRRRLDGQLPFEVRDKQRLAKLLRKDLAIARWYAMNEGQAITQDILHPTDSRGHTLDFHSLRHTCGAWLAIRGASPKVIQSIMRHSSISLTLDTYGHLLPGAEKDAVEHFSAIMKRKK